MLDDFLGKEGSQIHEMHSEIKQDEELTLIQREVESKSLRSAWISAYSTSVFMAVMMYFPEWHSALMKSGS
jgi:hypothetical protein